ncbi:MAG TPA: cupin domain-containing protein [Opitutaceae bacterium]|jgi:uncharacterized protein YjlB
MKSPESFVLSPSEGMPNNPNHPVLIYRGAVKITGDVATTLEFLFGRNGWRAEWRDSIYSYHHYHSTAYEALGVASGFGEVVLGGPSGRHVDVEAGDVLVLPPGTAHCLVSSTEDLLVVGAYPEGQEWEAERGPADFQTVKRINEVPAPRADPVTGKPA